VTVTKTDEEGLDDADELSPPPLLEEDDAAPDPPTWLDNWAKPTDGGVARNTE
jgi:hypothetical protein